MTAIPVVARFVGKDALSERRRPVHRTFRYAVSWVAASDHCRLAGLEVVLVVLEGVGRNSKFSRHDSHLNDLAEGTGHNASVLVAADPDSGCHVLPYDVADAEYGLWHFCKDCY